MRVLTALILSVVGATASAAEPDVNKGPIIEYARQLSLDVRWPGEVNREAYVILEFDVLADGKTANIHLVDDGFHEKRFVDAATTALKKSKWQPRRANGQAVDSPGLRKAFKFSIHDMEPGITEEFKSEALKVEELLNKGDFAGGEFHAQWMLAEKVTLNYEYAILEAELAQTYAGLGRIEDAVRKIARATARSDSGPEFLQLLDTPPRNKPSNYLLEKDLIVQLLGFRMRLLAAQGQALEAMQSYYELVGLQQLPVGDPLAMLAGTLAAQIRGSGELRGKVEIRREARWRQYLSRRRFMLDKVRGGSIQSLFLACSAHSKELAYVPGEEWTVPEGWGLCAVMIGAEPGTTFEFVEYPDA
jgi:hypothetical protein